MSSGRPPVAQNSEESEQGASSNKPSGAKPQEASEPKGETSSQPQIAELAGVDPAVVLWDEVHPPAAEPGAGNRPQEDMRDIAADKTVH